MCIHHDKTGSPSDTDEFSGCTSCCLWSEWFINHYTLVCKHSLILIAGIKQKQQESLWTCTVNWATEEAQTVNRCFGVLIWYSNQLPTACLAECNPQFFVWSVPRFLIFTNDLFGKPCGTCMDSSRSKSLSPSLQCLVGDIYLQSLFCFPVLFPKIYVASYGHTVHNWFNRATQTCHNWLLEKATSINASLDP